MEGRGAARLEAQNKKSGPVYPPLRKTAEIDSSPKCHSVYAPKYKAAQDFPAAAKLPAARSRTPANIAGAPRLPGGTSRRLRDPASSRASLRHQFGLLLFLRRRLSVQNAIPKHNRLKLHRHLRNRFRMAQKKVSTRLQRLIKTLYQRVPPLFREINQHVHAENQVHPAHIHRPT